MCWKRSRNTIRPMLSKSRPFAPLTGSKCIHLDEHFDFRNHPCLVSELYGMSVFDFLKQNAFQPFPERHIQDFAKSLLKSVECGSFSRHH